MLSDKPSHIGCETSLMEAYHSQAMELNQDEGVANLTKDMSLLMKLPASKGIKKEARLHHQDGRRVPTIVFIK